MTVKTQIKWKRTAFRRNMKRFNESFLRGEEEEMTKLVGIWERGYNAIVASWENAPRFAGRVRYYPSTKRFFVRVQIIGDDDLIARFNAIDFGARRSGKADVEGNITPSKVGIKGIKYPVLKRPLPIPQGAQKGKRAYAEEIGSKPIGTMSKGEYDEFMKEYNKYVKGIIAKYTTEISPRGQAIQKFERDKRMPMRVYNPRTGKGGMITGPGTYFPAEKVPGGAEWKAIPYMYQVTLGDIEARNFTTGLLAMMATGSDTFGMGKIWPGVRTFRSWVRSGWRRGTKYYEQAPKS